MKSQIIAKDAPPIKGYPFSHAIVTGNLIFTSGQTYLTPEMQLTQGTIEEKAHQVMKNVEAILQAAGSSLDSVVKVTIYITDMGIYQELNKVYSTYFSEPYPAREVVCVKSLPLDAEIEISVIAEKP